MWTNKDPTNFTPRGFPFSTPQWKKNRTCSSNLYSSPPCDTRQLLQPASERKWKPPQSDNNVNFSNATHKVPAGDSPYSRAKHVQVVDKNPSKAVSLFWAAINSGDRVDSALKDMATTMKQLDRSNEAIEAIKSFRHLCPLEEQESLDNIMLDLYKSSGRIEEQRQLLELRLKQIEDASMQKMNRTRIARFQGKKIQITMGQEYSRLLGNLAWIYLQQDKYKVAEEIYRKALSMEKDKNKQCNLAICLMYMNQMTEAKFLLNSVEDSTRGGRQMDESCAKSYDRAIQVLLKLESCKRHEHDEQFSSFLSRNKSTDSMTHYLSPSPTRGTPMVPFTQPREKAGFDGGCFRKLQFGQIAENNDLEVKL
ncbi:unnamed protein product [Lactuca saligna]|uniref:Protein POLLENLESS 3-LIKE 2 n=1 Tax=Lactuca saligna TaxID=75948 RepID=A0AA35YKH8_LACSI|nr:unnamed protein product [Lactuca saligna]